MTVLQQIANSDSLFIVLGRLAKKKGVVEDHATPLQSLVHTVPQRHLPESTPTAQSKERRGETSALEIDCVWALYTSLSQSESDGLPLTSSTVHSGQLVSLVQTRKPIAEEAVVGHDGILNAAMDDNGSTTKIKITAAYSLVRITKVLVPGSQVCKHKQTVKYCSGDGVPAKSISFGDRQPLN
ncbi:hypothetical protein AAF712_015215 [Marasmius tenuissimus]|uniref:Uncharacterized protein n=1 Tax=Marasmius tenuissimus TaxID=585030 RepID=A0ABR2Z949_9AGAR